MLACNATNVEVFSQHHLITVIFLKNLMINAIFAILKFINDVNENCMQFEVILNFEINFLKSHVTTIITEKV